MDLPPSHGPRGQTPPDLVLPRLMLPSLVPICVEPEGIRLRVPRGWEVRTAPRRGILVHAVRGFTAVALLRPYPAVCPMGDLPGGAAVIWEDVWHDATTRTVRRRLAITHCGREWVRAEWEWAGWDVVRPDGLTPEHLPPASAPPLVLRATTTATLFDRMHPTFTAIAHTVRQTSAPTQAPTPAPTEPVEVRTAARPPPATSSP